MKIIAIIGARLNSSRLPGKHLMTLAGLPMIERLLERLRHCQSLDKIILATTKDEYNQALIDWANTKVPYAAYSGDVNDLVGRIDSVVTSEMPDYLVYICGDCPLVEPKFVDHSFNQLIAHHDADSIHLKQHIKSIHEGMEFYSLAGWEKLVAISSSAETREHVGYANRLNPTLNTFEITDSDDFSSIDHRISVDTPADYAFMNEVYTRWYNTHPTTSIVDLKWVQGELLKDKQLREINSHVTQKKPEFRYQKISFFCHVSETIGLGHLRRCATLAAGLQEHLGVGTNIHIQGSPRDLPWLNTNAIWYHDFDTLIENIQSNQDNLLVFDFHPSHIDSDLLVSTLRKKKKVTKPKIIALDRLSSLLDVANELFVPSFYSKLKHPKINFGWQNYLLPNREEKLTKKQILILTGGSDALHYGQTLPTFIEENISPDWDLIWVQGPYAEAPHLAPSSRWSLLHNPDNIQECIAESAVILSCYGLSLFESIASGALTLLLPPKHLCDQGELDALINAQVCLVTTSMEELKQLLSELDDDSSNSKKIKRNAEHLLGNCDGLIQFTNSVKKHLNNA